MDFEKREYFRNILLEEMRALLEDVKSLRFYLVENVHPSVPG